MLRLAKIALVMSVALWGAVGVFLNVLHINETVGAVGAVTSMATIEGGAESWKATSNPIVAWMGAVFIMAAKALAAILCTIGAAKMIAARGAEQAAFARAKEVALAGCAAAIFMLFAGFIVIAESWFELWRSDAMRGPVLESAFRYGGFIALIAIFVSADND